MALLKPGLALAVISMFDELMIVPSYRASINKFSENVLCYAAESVIRVAVLEIDIHATCGSVVANFPYC